MKKFLLPLFLIGCAFSGAITTQGQTNYEPYSFVTVAGLPPGSADGTGSTARFQLPQAAAVDSAGNIYVADTLNSTIRKVTPLGAVTTLAGVAGVPGSVDGTGSAARFQFPAGVAVDSAGFVYVADYGDHTIRKITPAGVVSTLAGAAGIPGSTDGTGSAARINTPGQVAIDSAGNVYVADYGNHTIRKITPAGVVSTLAGAAGVSGSADGSGSAARFNNPNGVAVDGAGNVYVADYLNHTIRQITPAGVVNTLAGAAGVPGSTDGTGGAALFNQPSSVTLDSAGNIYVADALNDTVRKITSGGVVSTLAGLATIPGNADGTGNAARFNFPTGVTADGAGNVYVADNSNSTIRKITSAGSVSTLAGLSGSGSADGPGGTARFFFPEGAAVDSAGNVYVGDRTNHTIRKITSGGVVSTLAGLAGTPGSADGTGSAARFRQPCGVAVDNAGNVYVADLNNYTIRKITPAGAVSALAGLAGVAGSADGTGIDARFNLARGVAVDSAGTVYVGDTFNHTIRKITPAGVVSTLAGSAGVIGSADGTGGAARFNQPRGLVVDSAGNIYVADTFNSTIRKITPAGSVSTLAGSALVTGGADGPSSVARFNLPYYVALDGAENVYVGDAFNNTTRKITPAGVVSTLAGSAGVAGSADGTGRVVRFNSPRGVAVDSAGKLYVADLSNDTIRVGVAAPPVITSPLLASATVGQQFVYQYGTDGATSVGVTNPPPGLTFRSDLTAIVGNPTVPGTFSVGLSATNAVGPTNATLTITVQPAPSFGPVIQSGTAATGRTGQSLSLHVITTGGSPAARVSASGLPAGLSIDPVSGLISGTTTAVGSFSITLTVTDGNVTTTSTLQLTLTSDPTVPVIISPDRAGLTPGSGFMYSIMAPSSAGPSDPTRFTYSGTLPPGLMFDEVNGIISGIYTPFLLPRENGDGGPRQPDLAGGALLGSIQLFATNSHGTSTILLEFLPEPSGAVNIATRLLVGTGENVLIGGFIIQGNAPKVVLIRAIGPSLANFGVPNALEDPTLKLIDSAGHEVVSDNWRTNPSQALLIMATMIPPTDDRESAIVIGLDPGNNYTARVEGKNGATGIALVEVYDLGTASLDVSGNSKLGNISTRGFVDTGNNVMIGGFIIKRVNTRVVIRAIGPSLTAFGISGALQDPILELRNANAMLIGNDDWQDDPTQAAEIQQAALAPGDSRESALVTILPTGQYTAIVRGKGGTTGVAVVEGYALQ